MVQQIFTIFLAFIILCSCKESDKDPRITIKENKIGSDSIILNQTEEMTAQDTVSQILFSFLTNVNSKYMDSYLYSKRIDKISANRIKVLDRDNPNFNSLLIRHKDSNTDFLLAKVIVPKDFNIQSLNNGWVCSIRNREHSIDGPLGIYYPNLTKMYLTTYKDGLAKNENVYDEKGGIITQASIGK